MSKIVRMEREKFQEISASSASHSRKFAQDSHRRNFFQKKRMVRKLNVGNFLPRSRSPSELRSIFLMSFMLLRSAGSMKGPLQPAKPELSLSSPESPSESATAAAAFSLMNLMAMPERVPWIDHQ